MPPSPLELTGAVEVFIQSAPEDVFGKNVGEVVRPVNFPDGQISPGNAFLNPKLPDVEVSDFTSTSPRADALSND